MRDLWMVIEPAINHLNDCMANDCQPFVEVTDGPYAGSIVPVELNVLSARTGTTKHSYKGKGADVYAMLMAEANVGFNYFASDIELSADFNGKKFNFGSLHDMARNRYKPAFLKGYEGQGQIVHKGKVKA
jgi:hypothetical protein